MQIAARCRQVRLEHSLSLEALAAKAGVSSNLLARFENGQEVPTLETLDKLAEALGVPLSCLFYDNTDSNLTPRLTPRPTLQELIEESIFAAPDPAASPSPPQTAPERQPDSPPPASAARRR